MELRLDRLLSHLRDDAPSVLAAIDADPLLLRRESGELVLSNASKNLFSPTTEHQLFAKGIVYARSPYRLISLPLVKIYNVGEKEVGWRELAAVAAEPGVSLRFLHKYDGTMIQRFQHGGRAVFTTRGMLEGAAGRDDEGEPESPLAKGHFDYLACARAVVRERYPKLLETPPEWDGLTLVMELLAPESRVITNYGDRRDLVLLGVFERESCRYWAFEAVERFAAQWGLTAAESYSPPGDTLEEQAQALLGSLAGTDREGSVITFERGGEVIYRAKLKTPDYLRLLRLSLSCTYGRTSETLESYEELPTWDVFRAKLQELGRDQVPEELLDMYREHYEAYTGLLRACEELADVARGECERIVAGISPALDARGRRAAFARQAVGSPRRALLFLALDGKLTAKAVREVVDDLEGAKRLGG